MLTEQQLDQFIDEFWEDIPNEAQEEEPAEDLEEYTLPSDGMIIRQMEKKGKVNRRTWFALALMLLVVHCMNALKAEHINKVSLIAFTQNDIGNAFWKCIGWTKREDLNYYDFTLNEENITAFNK